MWLPPGFRRSKRLQLGFCFISRLSRVLRPLASRFGAPYSSNILRLAFWLILILVVVNLGQVHLLSHHRRPCRCSGPCHRHCSDASSFASQRLACAFWPFCNHPQTHNILALMHGACCQQNEARGSFHTLLVRSRLHARCAKMGCGNEIGHFITGTLQAQKTPTCAVHRSQLPPHAQLQCSCFLERLQRAPYTLQFLCITALRRRCQVLWVTIVTCCLLLPGLSWQPSTHFLCADIRSTKMSGLVT